MKLSIITFALLLAGCGNTGKTFFLEDTLTTDQRLTAHDVLSEWNARVGNNGVRSDIVNEPSEATNVIGVRQLTWIQQNCGIASSGCYNARPGLVAVKAGVTPEGFKTILSHEVGHALGIWDHLDKPGLMDPSASGPWGDADLEHCLAQGVCE